MFGFLKKQNAPKSANARKKPYTLNLSEQQRRMAYVALTVILLVIAIFILFAGGGGTQSIKACKGIIFSLQRNSCFQVLAGSTKNASACTYISATDTRNSCITNVAELNSDVSTCNQINSTNRAYDNCVSNLSRITKNISYCQFLDDPYESECAFSFAKSENFTSSSSCTFIYGSSQRGICNSVNNYNNAVATKNFSYCSLLPNVQNTTLTTYIFSQSSNKNSSDLFSQLFLYAQLNITPQNYCYYKIATITTNRTACGHVSGLLSEVCNSTISSTNATKVKNITNVTTACGSAPDYLKSICVSAFLSTQAISNKNVSICLQINDLQYRYSCITNYAIRFNTSSSCSYIKNSTAQQACYVSTLYRNSTTK